MELGLRDGRVGIEQLQADIADIRTRIDTMPNPTGPADGTTRPQWNSNPKKWPPEILNRNYKELWRTWSYKTREWLTQYDATLAEKLELIESKAEPLTDAFIRDQNISEQTNLQIKRFLVHRLAGDPGEVVREARRKHALEQYRILAQLCDPAAAGRSWSDSQSLYHPSAATSIMALPAKIVEWKNLETRCKTRTGESVPPTLRTMVLLNLCPTALKEKLMTQPEVGTGRISFDDPEALIMTNVHQNWDRKGAGGTRN